MNKTILRIKTTILGHVSLMYFANVYVELTMELFEIKHFTYLNPIEKLQKISLFSILILYYHFLNFDQCALYMNIMWRRNYHFSTDLSINCRVNVGVGPIFVAFKMPRI